MLIVKKISSLKLGFIAFALACAGLGLSEQFEISIGYLMVCFCYCFYTNSVLKQRESNFVSIKMTAAFLGLFIGFFVSILFWFNADLGGLFSLRSLAINNALSFVFAAYAEELLLRECLSRYLLQRGIKIKNLLWISPLLFVLVHTDLSVAHFTSGLIYLVIFIVTLSIRVTIACHLIWNFSLAFFKCAEWAIFCRSGEQVSIESLISADNLTRVFLISVLLICCLIYKRNETSLNEKFVHRLAIV
jgi:hypothetical protein